MRIPLLLAATLLTGCFLEEDDPEVDDDVTTEVTFRVIDTTGARRPDATVSCDAGCSAVGCSSQGTTAALDDGRHVCRVEQRPSGGPVWLRANLGVTGVSAVVDPEPGREPEVVIFAPDVAFEDREGQRVISWTSAHLPGTAVDGFMVAYVEPWTAAERLEPDDTSIAVPLEDLEDFSNPGIHLWVWQVIDGHEHEQWTDVRALPPGTIVPPSRGASCSVTIAGQTVEHAAGECPLTDGEPVTLQCCEPVTATIDLGVEQAVRRVRVRGYDGTLAVSTDGATFTEVDDVDERGNAFESPLTARYVRVEGVVQLGEISVFAP